METPGKKEFVLKKIPLKQFMSLLHDIYQSGADFVDLHGFKDEDMLQDEVVVSVPISYMNPEFAQEVKDEAPDPPPGLDEDGEQLPFQHEIEEGSLTDNDIDNLLKNV